MGWGRGEGREGSINTVVLIGYIRVIANGFTRVPGDLGLIDNSPFNQTIVVYTHKCKLSCVIEVMKHISL